MSLKRRILLFLRKLLGTQSLILELRDFRRQGELRARKSMDTFELMAAEMDSRLSKLNQDMTTALDRLNHTYSVILEINHRSLALDQVAVRISTLDSLNHRLQDLDTACLKAADQVAVDAESVELMVKLVEKALGDLQQQMILVANHARNEITDSATSR